MIFRWLRSRKRRQILSRPFPEEWRRVLERVPFYETLDEEERAALREIVQVFVEEKNWLGGRGFVVTPEMKVSIAAQAGHLILSRPHDFYSNVETIVVHPGSYGGGPRHHDGLVGESPEVLGEAWLRGPVVLAWNHVKRGARREKDGRNVVYHEFAHKLDMQDGVVDGTPTVERANRERWYQTMTRELEQLVDAKEKGRATLLDKYGTTNPAEFFAVATECFFERARALRERHPELYRVLADFYRQDPAERY